jgi:DNA-binding IclR family transcriptional regulator
MPSDESASPPTDRVVDVVELLAASTEPTSSSEAARRLGLSVSTCTSILRALAARGWAARDDDKRYVLGSGLLVVLDGLRRRHPMLGAADEELLRLADELGHGVTLTRITNEALLVVAASGALPEGVAPGHRFPLSPPYGVIAKAWAPSQEFDAWLDDAPIPLDRAGRAQLRRAAADIRDRGWVAWRMQPSTAAVIDAVRAALTERPAALPAAAVRQELARLGALLGSSVITAEEVEGRRALPVTYIIAPVGAAPATYQLELHLLEPAIRPAELRRIGTRLRDVAGRLGRATA